MNDDQINPYTVIVADGTFPRHEIPLEYLKSAERIVCCDGSAENLIKAGYIPDAIVGDMDSLDQSIAGRFHDRIFRDTDQETNDLTKAVNWCSERGYTELVILGATGKREDHAIGNISLLAEYIKTVKVKMVTDTGILTAITEGSAIVSFPGQQVSVFSIDPETEITSDGLRYPLDRKKIDNWWVATLNEAKGESFSLDFSQGRVIVYLKFEE
ncbi:MAG: thiamine diphosphokinase [Bacteroidales bacterium]|nr:thiamine diphosphokinase [Bacteroidales bacterium]